MKKWFLILLVVTTLSPSLANAWWNADWSSRKKITLNTVGTDIKQPLALVPILVRLHTGNFSFPDAKEDGSDIRFVSGDDKTPLKYHIEKFDPVNELALVWVQIPQLAAAAKPDFVWLYYGNAKVAAADDAKGSYDVNQIAVLHFAEKDGVPKDVTGYANNAAQLTAIHNHGSLIGGGLTFDGKGSMTIPATPSLKFTGAGGLTFSAWIKIGAAQQNAVLFAQKEGAKSISVVIDQTQLIARLDNGDGAVVETPHTAQLAPDAWHHIAVSAGQRLTVYVDGKEAASIDASMPDIQGEIVVGKSLVGELDELGLANVARSPDWIKATAKSEGPDSTLLSYGEDEAGETGGSNSHFGAILHSVTLDGWVVIAILVVMAAISWMVMVSKVLVIGRTEKGNKDFLRAFHKLKVAETAALDQDDVDDDADIGDSPLMSALVGKHDHYQDSSLYHIYHAGAQEIKHRFGDKTPTQLSPQAIDVIKARLDAALVREHQKLNSLMVLLTIAISGGPFLGLLGTVVGVMITFAAIAATGDVNVAAIAPGIAAALVATVAGLAVAIPALFGYNYLGSKIKNINADMNVFVDEFVGKIAESYSK